MLAGVGQAAPLVYWLLAPGTFAAQEGRLPAAIASSVVIALALSFAFGLSRLVEWPMALLQSGPSIVVCLVTLAIFIPAAVYGGLAFGWPAAWFLLVPLGTAALSLPAPLIGYQLGVAVHAQVTAKRRTSER